MGGLQYRVSGFYNNKQIAAVTVASEPRIIYLPRIIYWYSSCSHREKIKILSQQLLSPYCKTSISSGW